MNILFSHVKKTFKELINKFEKNSSIVNVGV